MAITLGGVSLSDQLIWQDEQDYSTVVQDTVRTLGGNLKVYSQSLSKGVPITLVAVQDQGWLTHTQVLAIRALADTAGAQYSLTLGSQSFTVMFRHHESPAFSAAPLIARIDAPAGDFFTCTIKLMTV